MKKLLLPLISLLFAAIASAQPTIKVEAPNLVSLDEQFRVAFVIEGESKPKDFQWSVGDDFQLVWGPQRGSSTSISMVNGKTTKSVQNTFTYILMPKKAGSFRLQAATATIDGTPVTSRAASIEVVSNGAAPLPQSSQPQGQGSGQSQSRSQSGQESSSAAPPRSGADVFMAFSLSKTSAVVGEPLTAVLKLYKHQRTSLAGFEGAKFPTFNGFWSQEVDAPNNIDFHREKVGDNIYDAAVIRSWSIIPQKAGSLTIDPAELVCLVNEYTGRSGSGSIFDSFFEDQYTTVRKRTVSRAYTVQVSPLPSGAPAGFGGGVGEFKISTRLSKDTLKTHDAASLLVTVSGKGNVSLLEAPKVSFPPDFESYDVKMTQSADRTGTSGSKTFEFPFIPRSAGEFVIPSIPYAYYSTAAGKYVQARTDSLRIKVLPGEGGTASLENAPSGPSVDRRGVKDLGSDIRFIKTGKPSLDRGASFFVGSSAFYVILAVLAIAALAVWLSLRSIARRRADVRGTRDRRATRMALSRLKAAEGYLKKGLPTAFYEELHRSLLGFVGDKLAMDMAEQNKENISAALQDRGVETSLATEFTDLLDACEAARYSPSSGDDAAMDALYGRAVQVISSLASGMKGKKSSSIKGVATALVLALLLPSFIPARAMTDAELTGLWNSGMEAYNAGHYDLAAGAWQKMIDDGIVSAELYYNTGNARFKEGKYAQAVLCYERALKLDPSDKDVRYNLEYARGFVTDKIDAVPEFILKTWVRSISRIFPSNAWAWIAISLFSAFLALLLLFLLGGSPAARRAGFFAGIVALLLALMAFGFARSLRRESLSKDAAIVTATVTSVRSAPSGETSTELFILHEGTRVEIREQISGWDNVTLSDGREGWIPAKDIEII